MSLKERTITGIIWKTIGNFTTIGVEFLIGIVLARLLSPTEFGLVATIGIIILISEVFINSGFHQAIIRKQDCTQIDYSTTFYFNLIISILFFLILQITARPFSHFFNEPQLKSLIQVLSIGLIISALTIVQQATLTKKINFKLQTRISIIASLISGISAIILAFWGFGVWSLVLKNLLFKLITSILLWIWNDWRPLFVFSKKSFNELFGFGSKLLLSGIIGTILNNLNNIVIAKFFSTKELGYYARAEMFERMFSDNINSIVSSVSYPALSTLQNDMERMKRVYREIFIATFFVISLCMVGLAVVSKPLIYTLIGEKWGPSVELMQLLCIVGIIAPLNSMNINILNVVGRSDLYLKLQLYTQILSIPNLFLGYFWGIKALIIGMIINCIIAYLIFNTYTKKIIKYSILEQIKDILPSLFISLTMGSIVLLVSRFLNFHYSINLSILILTGIISTILICELFKIAAYCKIKNILFEKIIKSYR